MRPLTLVPGSLARNVTLLALLCACDDGGSPGGNQGDGGMHSDGAVLDGGNQGDGAAPDAGPDDAGKYLPPPEPVDPWDDVASSIGSDVTDLYTTLCARLV